MPVRICGSVLRSGNKQISVWGCTRRPPGRTASEQIPVRICGSVLPSRQRKQTDASAELHPGEQDESRRSCLLAVSSLTAWPSGQGVGRPARRLRDRTPTGNRQRRNQQGSWKFRGPQTCAAVHARGPRKFIFGVLRCFTTRWQRLATPRGRSVQLPRPPGGCGSRRRAGPAGELCIPPRVPGAASVHVDKLDWKSGKGTSSRIGTSTASLA